jgi:hypothetical protein
MSRRGFELEETASERLTSSFEILNLESDVHASSASNPPAASGNERTGSEATLTAHVGERSIESSCINYSRRYIATPPVSLQAAPHRFT